jgi:hypothetical protein
MTRLGGEILANYGGNLADSYETLIQVSDTHLYKF